MAARLTCNLCIKRMVIPLLSGLLAIAVRIEAQPDLVNIEFFDSGENDDSFRDFYALNGGGFYACGQAGGRPWLVRVNEEGVMEWEYQTDGIWFHSIIEADNGDAVSAGVFAGQTFAAVRITSEGDEVWRREFGVGRAFAVIELKDGGFVLSGWGRPVGGVNSGYVIRITGDGEVDWAGYYGQSSQFLSMRETEGGVILCGYLTENRVTIGVIIKVDLNGDLIWSRRVEQIADERPILGGIISMPENRFAILATASGSPAILKVNNAGEVLETLLLPNVTMLWPNGIDKATDGGFALVGQKYQEGRYYPLVVRTDRQGRVLWTNDFRNFVAEDEGRSFNEAFTILTLPGDEFVVCGRLWSPFENQRTDGFIATFAPDPLFPVIFSKSPEDSIQEFLPQRSLTCTVVARNAHGNPMFYQWDFGDSLSDNIGNRDDTSRTFRLDTTAGDYPITCRITNDVGTVRTGWLVKLRNLFIASHAPDTLSLTIQRNSEIDFALDSVAYIGDLENLRYEWMIYDSAAVRWEEVGGDDRIGIRSYAFDRTGGYALKARVFDPNVDPVPADSVQWAIQVRGVIRAYEPNLPELSLEPRLEATFELIPFNANNDSIQFWWTLNEADTLSTQSTLSMSFQDTGRYVVSGYARERVSEEEWEEDVQVWVVNVHSLSAGLDPRLRGDDEGESEDDEGGSGDDDPLSLTIAPNPFNDQATVTIDLGGRAFLPAQRADKNVRPPRAQMGGLMPVRLSLYALDGREVLRFHNGPVSLGTHQFRFFTSFRMTSGVYFLRLLAGSHSHTVKAVLLR